MRLNIFNLNFRKVITQKLVDILFRIYINLQRFHNIFEFSPEAKNFFKHFSVIFETGLDDFLRTRIENLNPREISQYLKFISHRSVFLF